MQGGPGAAGLAVKEPVFTSGGGWVRTADSNSPSARALPGAMVFQGKLNRPAGSEVGADAGGESG